MRKFSILTDALPDSVKVFDIDYPVHTSFRNWVQISSILADKGIKDSKKAAEALKLCYKEKLPPNLISAMLGMMTFLHRDTDYSVSQSKKPPLFSFVQDADVIYASFMRQYGIDLTCQDMHWYTFCALLSALSEENPFAALVKIRSLDESSVKDPSRRAKLAELKARFALQDTFTREIDVAGKIETLF